MSMTLKCGSVKSFFMAAFFTSGDTLLAIKGLKSESLVSALASSRVSAGTSGGAVLTTLSVAGYDPATLTLPLFSLNSGFLVLLDGSAGFATTTGSASGLPARTSALRRDQRPRKPASCSAGAAATFVASTMAATTTATKALFSTHRRWVAKAVFQPFEALWPLALFRLWLEVFLGKYA